VVHDGIVEVEDDATGFTAQQSQKGLLKTLSLEEQDIVRWKLPEK
jgi:hypothetical protein